MLSSLPYESIFVSEKNLLSNIHKNQQCDIDGDSIYSMVIKTTLSSVDEFQHLSFMLEDYRSKSLSLIVSLCALVETRMELRNENRYSLRYVKVEISLPRPTDQN